MTISTTAAKKVLLANGATTAFGFDFYIPNVAALVVQTVDAVGNITTLTSGQYSVTGIGTSTGTVTISPALSNGITVVISRNVPQFQASDFTNQDGFYPEVIENALDLITMMIQQNTEAIGRAIKSPIADTGTITLPTAIARAGLFLGFDGSGNPIATATTVNAAAFSALMISWLSSLPTSLPASPNQPWLNDGLLSYS